MGFHSILLAIAMIVAATRLCHPLRAVRVDHPFGRAPLGSRQRWRTPGTENFLGWFLGKMKEIQPTKRIQKVDSRGST